MAPEPWDVQTEGERPRAAGSDAFVLPALAGVQTPAPVRRASQGMPSFDLRAPSGEPTPPVVPVPAGPPAPAGPPDPTDGERAASDVARDPEEGDPDRTDVEDQEPAVTCAEPLDPAGDEAFLELLADRRLRAVFQPMAELSTGELVGFEALARGPEGSPFESPGVLFSRADALGRTVELDWACRAAAFDTYMRASVPPSMSLFVNVEIASLMDECPEDLLGVVGRAEASLRVFVEIDDRALATDPAGLLATVERAREMGWGVSIDDIGSSLGCLSVLPMVRADVVKVGVRALTGGPDGAPEPVVAAVLRHVEATGATLVVKGIEDEADLHLAQAVGARYGQGHHLGSPGPLREYKAPRAVVPLVQGWAAEPPAASPFDLLAEHEGRVMTRTSMERVATIFFARAVSAGSDPLVLLGLGDGPQDETTRAVGRRRLDEIVPLTERAVLTAMYGVGCPPAPGGRARGVNVPRTDPVAEEPFLVIMTEHLSLALVGRRSRSRPGFFEVVMTQQPQAVCDVAQHLIRRIPPVGERNRLLPAPVVPPVEVALPEPAVVSSHPRGWSAWFGRRRRG